MIKNNLNYGMRKVIKVAEELYPKIKKYKVTINWDDSLQYRKRMGEITIVKKKATIIINPYIDYLDVLSTIRHELAHLVEHSKGKKLSHKKRLDRIMNKMQYKWVTDTLKEKRSKNGIK